MTDTMRRLMWPPPNEGQPATLRCACDVVVIWGLPLAFLYVVRIKNKGKACAAVSHNANRRLLLPLERFA